MASKKRTAVAVDPNLTQLDRSLRWHERRARLAAFFGAKLDDPCLLRGFLAGLSWSGVPACAEHLQPRRPAPDAPAA